jgi:hypothetical protein
MNIGRDLKKEIEGLYSEPQTGTSIMTVDMAILLLYHGLPPGHLLSDITPLRLVDD